MSYSVNPGESLFVSHKIDDTTATLFLSDRYGNPTNETLTGTLTHENESTQNVTFADGKFQFPKISGKYRVSVPALTNRTISSISAGNTYTFRGIGSYVFTV